DFDAIRQMLADEVRLELVNRRRLAGSEVASYFGNYAQRPNLRAVPGLVDRRPAGLMYESDAEAYTPAYFVLLTWAGGKLAGISRLPFRALCDRWRRDRARGLSRLSPSGPARLARDIGRRMRAQESGSRLLRPIVDERNAFPCRITLEDAEPGEHVLLLNYVHQPADTPFRASHAIYVREAASRAAIFVDDVPPALQGRLLSVRAFDPAGMMIDAGVVNGVELKTVVEPLLANDATAYLHVHYAKRGCYAARVDRAPA
ncbi:MAG: DUF1203 domain-containing protein, partial [Candidatus Elarobacter sp.]